MVAILFWVSAAVVLYVYAGYPCLLAACAKLGGRRWRREAFPAGSWPSISIIIAARNEAHRLPGRIANLLQEAYPGSREIIVVSDGSSDSPAAAVDPFGPAVRLIELPATGKPGALNAGVAASTGQILVFADARQRFAPGALTELAMNFADPRVAGATGELVLDAEATQAAEGVAEGVGLYWRYEKWLRRNESRVWSTLGATGAIYALRRSAWRPLPPATLVDDVLAPMRAVLAGGRVVFDERAIAYDRAASDAAVEARRKTRTLAGNYQILRHEPRLLVPIANPVWLQYVSHKLGRLLVPWFLVVLFVCSAALSAHGAAYAVVLAAEVAFYGLAVGGGALRNHQRVSRVAFTFVMMNYSAVAGLVALRRGREVWR